MKVIEPNRNADCQYCHENPRTQKCKSLLREFDHDNGFEKIELSHLKPCNASPTRNHWRLVFERFGCRIGVKIYYCPMCGRKLAEADDGND